MDAADKICLRCLSRDCPHVTPRIPAETLNSREFRMLQLVADGESNKTVAHQLGVSESVVRHVLSKIYDKLRIEGGNPRVKAAAWWRQNSERLAPCAA